MASLSTTKDTANRPATDQWMRDSYTPPALTREATVGEAANKTARKKFGRKKHIGP